MMRQKGIAPIIILVLIALFGAGAYFLGTKNILKLSTLLPSSKISPSPSPSSTPDPTANWKTYTSKDGSFSFKYPQEASIQENSPSDNQTMIELRQSNQVPIATLNVYKNYKNNTAYSFLQDKPTGGITLNRLVWETYYYPKGSEKLGGPNPELNDQLFQLRISNNNVLYVFDFYGQDKLNEIQTQILSTFKFVD